MPGLGFYRAELGFTRLDDGMGGGIIGVRAAEHAADIHGAE